MGRTLTLTNPRELVLAKASNVVRLILAIHWVPPLGQFPLYGPNLTGGGKKFTQYFDWDTAMGKLVLYTCRDQFQDSWYQHQSFWLVFGQLVTTTAASALANTITGWTNSFILMAIAGSVVTSIIASKLSSDCGAELRLLMAQTQTQTQT
jgi:hypothetical protein